jgi:hypothetical protein
MHKNPVWLGLLGIICIAALWFAGKASWDVYQFYSISERTQAGMVALSVKKKSRNSYYPVARYSYHVDGKEYQGIEEIPSLVYYRKGHLEKDLPKIKKERKWAVWYSPDSPYRSSLSRSFPFKNVFYGFLMIGIFGYFLWLGFYVRKL